MPGQIKPRLYFKQQKPHLSRANRAFITASAKLRRLPSSAPALVQTKYFGGSSGCRKAAAWEFCYYNGRTIKLLRVCLCASCHLVRQVPLHVSSVVGASEPIR